MKALIFLASLLFITVTSSAQFIEEDETSSSNDSEAKFSDKLFFGGNLGFVFGNYTYINISPIIGYKITKELSAGTGIIYEYFSDKRIPGYYYQTSIYGGKVFAQSVLFERVILYAENNFLSLERQYFDYSNSYPKDGRFMINVPWIGGGLYQEYSNGGLYFMLLFNLNSSSNSPYPAYEYRMGINF